MLLLLYFVRGNHFPKITKHSIDPQKIPVFSDQKKFFSYGFPPLVPPLSRAAPKRAAHPPLARVSRSLGADRVGSGFAKCSRVSQEREAIMQKLKYYFLKSEKNFSSSSFLVFVVVVVIRHKAIVSFLRCDMHDLSRHTIPRSPSSFRHKRKYACEFL